ncbi:hypothetical protein ATKI12_6739 [Kitasatospora sp. Ki12]|uniref:hypothetical protein n=1 Tax=Kitasatospora xanthocidica TaxID=83382 RepID=UPI001671EAF5|nr:hypothetical protein [Kitasatospora xanthocidica]GHF73224.1 hypothetical protein GCM10018790_58910 [Kitasatospora xanthocidica]
MRTRIAAVMMTVAGIAGLTAGPAMAATATSEADTVACATVLNRPCISHQADGAGVVGIAQVTADPAQLTVVKVEVRTQAAWGSPWETAASATTVKLGSAKAVTPRVTTTDLRIICATAGPALDATKQVTTCTSPF